MILFVHFYIKKYNSVPLYFISFFNFDILLNFDAIKYNKSSVPRRDSLLKYNRGLLVSAYALMNALKEIICPLRMP